MKITDEMLEGLGAVRRISGSTNENTVSGKVFVAAGPSASATIVPSSAFHVLAASDNRVAGATKTTTSSGGASGSRKRKSATTLEEDIAAYKQDLSHIDVDGMRIDQNCNQIRKRINQILDSGIFKKGEFCSTIGSSSNSLNRFLGQSGPFKGSESEAYSNAWAWFKQRELAGLKMPDVKKRQKAEAAAAASAAGGAGGPTAKRAKTTGAAAAGETLPDLNNIHLPGEETDEVPVFDSADEIRKKINAHLKTPGLTQAQFCRDLYAQLKAPTVKAIQPKQLADFRGKRGPLSGCTSIVFYAAYVYFEKLRLAKGKPKSAHRLEMEMAHRRGLDRTFDGRHG